MTATVNAAAVQCGPSQSIAACASSTVARVSQTTRSSSSRLVCRGRSASTVSSRVARRSPPRSISSTRARDTRTSAASRAASTPASGTSSAATTTRRTSVPLHLACAPARQDSSRLACRANISRSSSGSAWS